MTAAKKIHSFKESLEKAQVAEGDWQELFMSKHPEYTIIRADGRSHDFVVMSPLGAFTIELKVDSFDMTKTPNIFVERWSSYEGKKIGGPYQAQAKGVDLYCYYFSKQKVMLTMPVNKLVLALDDMGLKDSQLIPVFNKGYTTKGYKISREALDEKGIVTYCWLDSAFDGLR